MQMETAYQVRAECEEAIAYIASLWEDADDVEACTFEQAVEDEIPLGGYLDIPYSGWRDSLLEE